MPCARKPYVNATCIGCSACVAISPDVFDLNAEGKSFTKSRSEGDYENLSVDDSIAACPVNAISWQECDENGRYKDKNLK